MTANAPDITLTLPDGSKRPFKAGGTDYNGRVGGDVIKGSVKSGAGASEWSATRLGRSATASAPSKP